MEKADGVFVSALSNRKRPFHPTKRVSLPLEGCERCAEHPCWRIETAPHTHQARMSACPLEMACACVCPRDASTRVRTAMVPRGARSRGRRRRLARPCSPRRHPGPAHRGPAHRASPVLRPADDRPCNSRPRACVVRLIQMEACTPPGSAQGRRGTSVTSGSKRIQERPCAARLATPSP